MRYHDLANQRFGRLVVLTIAPRPAHIKTRGKFWLCRCNCGNEHIAAARYLKHGSTRSCGCLQRERAAESARVKNATHGHTRNGKPSREYRSWCNIIARCTNPKNTAYDRYGGRGITMCPQWRHSFETFLKDVGDAPLGKYTIDRIDNDGNYEPSNVRWATPQEQMRNRSDRHPITFNGKTQFLTDWAKETEIRIGTLHYRIYKQGWSIERALTTDPRLYHNRI